MIKYSEKAAEIVSLILGQIEKEIRVGISGRDLEMIAISMMKKHKVKSSSLGYGGFPSSICVSINNELTHGVPDGRLFLPGDLVSVDIACSYKGFHGDAASTFLVEASSQEESLGYQLKKELIETTKSALYFAINSIVPGKTTNRELGSIIQSYVRNRHFFVIKEYGGHAIGRLLHMDPFIPNCEMDFDGEVLKPGMIICIEPLVQTNNDKVKLSSNGWTVVSSDGSLNAHFEHTILICENSVRILTNSQGTSKRSGEKLEDKL